MASLPIIILAHADFDRASGRIADAGLDKALAERYVSRPGVTIVSNRELFSSTPDPSRLFFDTSHWTSEGTSVVSRALGNLAGQLLGGGGNCT